MPRESWPADGPTVIRVAGGREWVTRKRRSRRSRNIVSSLWSVKFVLSKHIAYLLFTSSRGSLAAHMRRRPDHSCRRRRLGRTSSRTERSRRSDCREEIAGLNMILGYPTYHFLALSYRKIAPNVWCELWDGKCHESEWRDDLALSWHQCYLGSNDPLLPRELNFNSCNSTR